MAELFQYIDDKDEQGAIQLVQSGYNVNEVSSSGSTALQEAASENMTGLVETLLDYGANINAADEDGMTALHTASRKGLSKVVQILLSSGAQINLINSDGLTPLHFAAHRGHERVCELLLNKGASVTTPDHYDDLPIHFAASEGHANVINLLLLRGSPIAPQTNRGNTPLHLAAIKGKIDAVNCLLENGTPILQNGAGQSPLAVAEAKHKTDCCIAIRQYEGALEKKKRLEEQEKIRKQQEEEEEEEQRRQQQQQQRSVGNSKSSNSNAGSSSSSKGSSFTPPQLQHAESEIGMDPNSFISPGVGPIIPATIKPGMTTMDLNNMNEFVLTPPKPGLVLQGKVKRDKSGKSEVYSYVLENKLASLLLCAKKRSDNKTGNYAISTSKHTISSVDRKDPEFVGKLRSNFSRSEYHLYNNGENPAKVGKSYDDSKIRQELACIFYSEKYPREITVLTPAKPSLDAPAVIWRPMKPSDSMLVKYKDKRTENILILKNKAPSWNNEIHGYVLDFYGRVTMKSSKNFQLIAGNDDQNTDQVLLLFGRVSKNDFTLDFQYPVTPVQAFAIALTAFDTF